MEKKLQEFVNIVEAIEELVKRKNNVLKNEKMIIWKIGKIKGIINKVKGINSNIDVEKEIEYLDSFVKEDFKTTFITDFTKLNDEFLFCFDCEHRRLDGKVIIKKDKCDDLGGYFIELKKELRETYEKGLGIKNGKVVKEDGVVKIKRLVRRCNEK